MPIRRGRSVYSATTESIKAYISLAPYGWLVEFPFSFLFGSKWFSTFFCVYCSLVHTFWGVLSAGDGIDPCVLRSAAIGGNQQGGAVLPFSSLAAHRKQRADS